MSTKNKSIDFIFFHFLVSKFHKNAVSTLFTKHLKKFFCLFTFLMFRLMKRLYQYADEVKSSCFNNEFSIQDTLFIE
ncbi:MAG: hypothetical protein C0403_06290 [Desulfobacterium sp.]|nr:hypothetical protein [Desulfobacterium sp.]